MRKPKSYSIEETFPERINKIWKKSPKATSSSDWVNEVIEKALLKEEKKSK